MKFILLNNGMKMPMVGLGTWNLFNKECEKHVSEALEIGYRLIDTAQMYGNEKEIGNAIKNANIPRNELFITTKLLQTDNVRKAIEYALEKLQLETINLLLIHDPYQEAIKMY